MPPKTLGPVRGMATPSAPPSRPSQQLARNQEVTEGVMEKFRLKQDSLMGLVETHIHDQRRLPYVGADVLYRMGEGPSVGIQRPAKVLHLLEEEGDSTRCVLKVLCNPDLDGTGVLDEPNVRYGPGLNEWMPNDPRIRIEDPDLENRTPIGDA